MEFNTRFSSLKFIFILHTQYSVQYQLLVDAFDSCGYLALSPSFSLLKFKGRKSSLMPAHCRWLAGTSLNSPVLVCVHL